MGKVRQRPRARSASVLPLAATLGALWCGRGASAPAERRSRSADSGGPGNRARGAWAGDQCGDLGLRASRGLSHAPLADSPGAEHGAARPAPRGLGHAARPADDSRASRGAHRRAVDRPDPPTALARAPREHAPRRGHGARRAGVSGHLLLSATSKASARSGRLRPAMQPRRTAWPGCCPLISPPTRPRFCATSWCRTISGPPGRSAAC